MEKWYVQFVGKVTFAYILTYHCDSVLSTLARVTRKSFNGNLPHELIFFGRVFNVTITDADIGTLKSLHTLFDNYLDTCWWNLDKIVWSKLYTKFWAFWRKMESIDAILEDVYISGSKFDAELFIWRPPYFSVPKIMEVRHMYPGGCTKHAADPISKENRPLP